LSDRCGRIRFTGERVAALAERAAGEARLYAEAGLEAIAIENMPDVPYLTGGVGPEIVAAMTAIAREVRRAVALPCGVQVLAGANREALAVAAAADLDFVRVEGFVYAHVADEGLIEASAGPLLRYRRSIGAERVLVFADVKKKHSSHALTADVGIVETARTAAFFGADAVVVTGASTGSPVDQSELESVKASVDVPVLVGSGVTPEQAPGLLEICDGLIVGSSLKRRGLWSEPVDPDRVRALMRALGRGASAP
jgi:membrane complex biogenesis BtpA family protein